MNYIITKHPEFFKDIGQYNFCSLDELKTLPNEIAFDSETTGLFALEEDMFCIQIGTRKDNYLVHMYDDNYSFYDVIPYLKDKVFVMQNGLFDLGFMYKYNFIPVKVYDTMLATRILYNGQFENQASDFGSIMKRELGIYYDKTTQKNIHIVKLSQPSAIMYSFNDVDRLQEAHDVLLHKLAEKDQLATYELHCRFIKALAYMEQCGLPISSEKWLAKMEEDQCKLEEYQKIIGSYIYDNIPKYADTQLDMFKDFEKGTTVNLKSPKQMIDVFNSLGINTKDKDGNDSINESIISKSKHEFVALWLKYQEFQHRVSTFGKGVYDKIKNGRIYSNFNPMVDTARLSSRKGHINFLNFPSDKETRSCFVASKENKMIVCDWSGQETVISADVSGDAAMTKSVLNGDDLHSMLARVLFPELAEFSDEIIMTQYADKRKFAKAPRFAMQYGGNGYTLHVNENIPLKEAEDIFEKFTTLHSGLFEWGEKQLAIACKTGYIKSADGWRLYLPKFDWFEGLQKTISLMSKSDWTTYRIGKAERKREVLIWEKNKTRAIDEPLMKFEPVNKEAYEFYKSKRKDVGNYFSLKSSYARLALNNPVQTTGAHQMKLALAMIFEWIVENDLLWIVKMCNAVHDETVCEAPEHLSEMVRDFVGQTMRIAGDNYLTKLKIKADAGIGESWYEAK